MRLALLPVLLAIASLRLATADEFHVFPDGSPEGDGSAAKPWDLPTALAHPATVQPGDTIWLHGGIYRGSFESRLTGTSDDPVIVRQAPGEHGIISVEPVKGKATGFSILGEHARYQGFEVRCENPRRETTLTGSWPADMDRGAVTIKGSHIEAVNLIVHDLGSGFGFWREGEGGEIHGCVIYNNGWTGPDRGHGHAIYTQNERGVKKITDCIMFRQFGEGLHLYGSSRSSLRGFRVEGMVAFDASARGGGGRNLLAGGGAPLDDIMIAHCFTWGEGSGVQVGYSDDPANQLVEVRDNYFCGGIRLQYPGPYRITGNTVIADASLIQLQLKPNQGIPAGLAIDGNTYHRTEKRWNPFAILAPEGNRNGGFDVMRNAGFDANSTYSEEAPATNRVFVRPNRFEPGRGHIVVYNWEKRERVAADLSEVLKSGQAFRVVHAQDFFGEPVVEGVYDGKPVLISMKPRKSVSPIGWESKPEQTSQEFGAFVVLPR